MACLLFLVHTSGFQNGSAPKPPFCSGRPQVPADSHVGSHNGCGVTLHSLNWGRHTWALGADCYREKLYLGRKRQRPEEERMRRKGPKSWGSAGVAGCL